MFRKSKKSVVWSVAIVIALALLAFALPPMTGAQVVTATQSTVAPNPTACCPTTGMPTVAPNLTGIVLTTQPGATVAPVFTVVPINTTQVSVEPTARPGSDVNGDRVVDIKDIQQVAGDWHRAVLATPAPEYMGNFTVSCKLVRLDTSGTNHKVRPYVRVQVEGVESAFVFAQDVEAAGDDVFWQAPITVISPTIQGDLQLNVVEPQGQVSNHFDVVCSTCKEAFQASWKFVQGQFVVTLDKTTWSEGQLVHDIRRLTYVEVSLPDGSRALELRSDERVE